MSSVDLINFFANYPPICWPLADASWASLMRWRIARAAWLKGQTHKSLIFSFIGKQSKLRCNFWKKLLQLLRSDLNRWVVDRVLFHIERARLLVIAGTSGLALQGCSTWSSYYNDLFYKMNLSELLQVFFGLKIFLRIRGRNSTATQTIKRLR